MGNILRRAGVLIVLLSLVIGVVVFLVERSRPPKYEAQAVVSLNPLVGGQQLRDPDRYVRDQVGLASRPETMASAGAAVGMSLDAVRELVTVQPNQQVDSFTVTATTDSADLSARLANAVVQSYLSGESSAVGGNAQTLEAKAPSQPTAWPSWVIGLLSGVLAIIALGVIALLGGALSGRIFATREMAELVETPLVTQLRTNRARRAARRPKSEWNTDDLTTLAADVRAGMGPSSKGILLLAGPVKAPALLALASELTGALSASHSSSRDAEAAASAQESTRGDREGAGDTNSAVAPGESAPSSNQSGQNDVRIIVSSTLSTERGVPRDVEQADGVIAVARLGRTPREAIRRPTERWRSMGVPVVCAAVLRK